MGTDELLEVVGPVQGYGGITGLGGGLGADGRGTGDLFQLDRN